MLTTATNDLRSEISLVQVHANATSAERHMQLTGPVIDRGIKLAKTIRVQVFGKIGPVVTQALIAAEIGDGFAR